MLLRNREKRARQNIERAKAKAKETEEEVRRLLKPPSPPTSEAAHLAQADEVLCVVVAGKRITIEPDELASSIGVIHVRLWWASLLASARQEQSLLHARAHQTRAAWIAGSKRHGGAEWDATDEALAYRSAVARTEHAVVLLTEVLACLRDG